MAEENESSSKEKTNFSKYKLPITMIIVFILGFIVANSINANISGSLIASSSSEYQNQIVALELEKENLKNQLLEKNSIENQLYDSKGRLVIYEDILKNLIRENLEKVDTPYGFSITWDKYVYAEPGKEITWSAKIDNTDSSDRTFSLGLKIKSILDEAIMKKNPATGSLILNPQTSGTLNVKLIPEETGYVILGIYINDEFVGDLTLFSY